MHLIKMEYRSLNIFDEISVVEVAFDIEASTIHIVDASMTVAPTYNFTKKHDELSEGFLKMAQVLYQKHYMKVEAYSLQQWIDEITWQFYGLGEVVKTYENGCFAKNKVANLQTWSDEALQQANFNPLYIRKGKST
ncbi:aminopeptidase [Metasolibacillus meyeri]|uniref:Aminopeptidase n=1 Tax=Metasolibacillus meyeri TaxID=1071052 RepID=A0AAW9NQK8_9BACL|nr:aminopeptidase [Metasolibacillus meyeri]MEC1178295.1 aminopeptidase [Metasolibacillus meyeri]